MERVQYVGLDVHKKAIEEAGWHYRFDRGVGKRLMARRKGQPVCVVSYANKAGKRLSRKYFSNIYFLQLSKVTSYQIFQVEVIFLISNALHWAYFPAFFGQRRREETIQKVVW